MPATLNEHRKINRLPLFLAVLGCLYSTSGLAQEAETDPEEPTVTTETVELDRVQVTGSLLRRAEFESASPIQVITADTNATLGQVETAEFLRQSSVAAGSTQISHQFGGFVTEGGVGAQTISLRGLGAQRTLVLLDGKRPGPAGTRGQVGAFDLNVLPSSIVQRIEVLKDGSSSIYGSDAVAGVINVITRTNVDRPEFTVGMRVPFHSGGEVFTVSGATGWNFDNGSITLAGDYFLHEPLRLGDRDYLRCPQDLFWDANGDRLDREDRSITAGTRLSGCNSGNLYANTVIDAVTGARYIPSPDGTTIGLIPGYRPRQNAGYTGSDNAFYEDVLNFDFMGDQTFIARQERVSLYASSDFTFGNNVNWTTQWLYNNRQTEQRAFRQFFPLTGGATAVIPSYQYANDPDYVTPVPSGIAQPILPFRSNNDVEVDYFYVNTGLDGLLNWTDTWAWQGNVGYTRSSGKYNPLVIVASRSGDVQYDDNAPVLDYFDPYYLSGEGMDELVSVIGGRDPGKTIYEQTVFNAFVTGELFNLPAGPVAAALGVEWRNFSIDDQPGEFSRNGDLWGQSSAQVTKGDDTVKEVFLELEAPLLRGLPGFESLSINASGRVFDYDSVGESDNVWKLGLNWQVIPSLRVRATKGTSYRAPGLYELYLGDQSAFVSQLAIDPCINWGESTNDFIRANCAAAGIPDTFAGGASSATVFTGGGAGFLTPETSRALTTGIVFTPAFAPISIALDYFEFEVNDQIGSLGSGAILGGCYGAQVYPNNFCNMFVRNPNNHETAPNAIDEVYATYVNIDKQKTRGYDLQVRYDNDFAFGNLVVESEATYIFEDIEQLFDSSLADGYDTNDRNGSITRPKLVGNVRTSLKRGDFTYTWFMNYVHPTRSLTLSPETTYNGAPAFRDIYAERRLYHTASVLYDQPDWQFLIGVSNIFGKAPPTISSGIGSTRYGNIPAFATQYDWYGRSLFARYTYKF